MCGAGGIRGNETPGEQWGKGQKNQNDWQALDANVIINIYSICHL